MRKLVIVTVTGLLVFGMGYTVFFDYKPWVHAMKDNYGHGPGELGTKGVANKLFVEDASGIRINYPESWTVDNLWINVKVHPENDVVVLSAPTKGVKVMVARFVTKGSLTDLVDARAKEREQWGWTTWGERQYITTDRTNMTVLTWQVKQANGEVVMKQEGLTKTEDKLVVVTADCTLTDWRTFKGTFWEMFSSVVVF